jgi:hypothetical protein
MKKNYLNTAKHAAKAVAFVIILFAAIQGKAQCSANFSYFVMPNGSVHFLNTSTSSSPVSAYWNFGDGGFSYGDSAVHTFATNGWKSVCIHIVDTLSSTSTCSATYCDSIHVTTVAPPTNTTCSHSVIYSMSKDSTQSLTWNAYPTYPANVSNATWYWGDGSTSTGLYPTHTYSAAGTYSTCVTVSVTCDSLVGTYCYVASIFRSTQSSAMITMNVKQAEITGIASVQKDNSLLAIYPNPSNGLFILELSGQAKDSKELSVSVYNMLGEKVFEKTGLSASKQGIDVSTLSNGTYFVKVVADQAFYTKKISVQK